MRDEGDVMSSKFNVGDRVRILSWEEMENLYGIEDDGDIYIPNDENYFCRAMKEDGLCGLEGNVIEVYAGDDTATYVLDSYTANGWTITEGMLELVPKQEPDFQEFQTDSFFDFVTCIKE